MKRLHFVILCLILLLFSNNSLTYSQQQQSGPTGLALEVTYYRGRPPTYQTVLAADSKGKGDWYGAFGHVPSWQPPAGSLPVQGVSILAHVEGDAVRVEVSVLTGVKMIEKEMPAAAYHLRENERVRTDALTQFGVEPFEIKVVRVDPASTALPQVSTRAESIAVLNIQANNSTLPSYKLQLRNLSNKNVVALGVILIANNRVRRIGMPHDPEGRPLIEAGSVYNHMVTAPLNPQSTPDGYAPNAPVKQEIVVTTAVFDDGTYEGDTQTAATIWSLLMGDEIQVRKVIPVIEAALNDTDPNLSEVSDRFKKSVTLLGNEAKGEIVNELQQAFSTLSQEAKANLKTSVEVSLSGVKFDLLKSLQQLEKANNQSLNAATFHAWLSETKERYEKWLVRLTLLYAKWHSETKAPTQ